MPKFSVKKPLTVFVAVLASAVVGLILQFFFFNLDYTRTERVQFEDDEYYYYVKAVPKINVSTPNKKVKKINTKRVETAAPKTASTVKTANGVKRTSQGEHNI